MKKIALFAVLASCLSNATVLTFSDLNLSNYGVIPAAYGDHVAGQGSFPNGTYGTAGGWTPNVGIGYETGSTPGSSNVSNHLDFWSTSYGDLEGIAFASQTGEYAGITLTPDAGHNVQLTSFDIAGWPTSDLPLAALEVIDGNGNVLWNSNATVAHGAGPSHDSYAPGVISSGPITLVWGTNWNIGVDNVQFSQDARAVPEPVSLSLLGLAVAAVAKRRRK